MLRSRWLRGEVSQHLGATERLLGTKKRTRTKYRELRRTSHSHPLRFQQEGAFKRVIGSA
jgi:hypothetical protein